MKAGVLLHPSALSRAHGPVSLLAELDGKPVLEKAAGIAGHEAAGRGSEAPDSEDFEGCVNFGNYVDSEDCSAGVGIGGVDGAPVPAE